MPREILFHILSLYITTLLIKMGNYGIKIAKPTANINSNNPKDYIFWSKYESLSLYGIFSGNITLYASDPNRETYVNVYHNLGYYPIVKVLVKDCNNLYSILPLDYSECVDCGKFYIQSLFFTYYIYPNYVRLYLSAYCYERQGQNFNIFSNLTFNYKIYVFTQKLK